MISSMVNHEKDSSDRAFWWIVMCKILQLLGDILLDRSNSAVMTKYVSSMDNLRILMNLLRVWCFTRYPIWLNS